MEAFSGMIDRLKYVRKNVDNVIKVTLSMAHTSAKWHLPTFTTHQELVMIKWYKFANTRTHKKYPDFGKSQRRWPKSIIISLLEPQVLSTFVSIKTHHIHIRSTTQSGLSSGVCLQQFQWRQKIIYAFSVEAMPIQAGVLIVAVVLILVTGKVSLKAIGEYHKTRRCKEEQKHKLKSA